jgi:thiol:disulfide interchange protein DsbD
VQGRFAELGITAMKADWTSQDEKIGQALSAFGRNSVPLYVLYGRTPSADPVILPEILSPGIVLNALEDL